MTVRYLLAALAAGLLAGILMTPVQYKQVIPIILHAEEYEGAAGHDHAADPADHTHDDGAVHTVEHEPVSQAAAPTASVTSEEPLLLGRFWNTVFANLVTGAGFALLMAGVSLVSGVSIRFSTGLAWGAAGWLAAQFLPGIGLPPELPGFPYVDVAARQFWWTATVAASIAGLALLFLRRDNVSRAAGIALLLAPHLYGAPQPADISAKVPAYLAAEFVMAALSTTLFFWLALGLLLGLFMDRAGESRVSALGKIILVIGGARSGKSAFAEGLAEKSGLAKVYVATGQAFDREMSDRIDTHKARRGPDWENVEDPFDLAGVLKDAAGEGKAVLVDCLTLWVTNLMLEQKDVDIEAGALLALLLTLEGEVIFVSSEVGLGIVPENYLARAFRDHAGRLHQDIAAIADEVYFVAAGLPLKMKG